MPDIVKRCLEHLSDYLRLITILFLCLLTFSSIYFYCSLYYIKFHIHKYEYIIGSLTATFKIAMGSHCWLKILYKKLHLFCIVFVTEILSWICLNTFLSAYTGAIAIGTIKGCIFRLVKLFRNIVDLGCLWH